VDRPIRAALDGLKEKVIVAKFVGHDVLADGTLSQTGNGCDITIQKLQFKNLSVKWQAAAFPAVTASAVAPRAHAARTLDGAAVFSLEPR